MVDSTPQDGEDDSWVAILKLWDMATGGPNAAASPQDETEFWPVSTSAPGLDEAASWFKQSLDKRGPSRILVLLGGPGAGKSLAAARLVAGLEPLDAPDDGLAHRTYRYETGSSELRVINDATIPPEGGVSLAHEIRDCVTSHSHLLLCINRGVLVEEIARMAHESLSGPGAALLQWLYRSSPDSGSRASGAPTEDWVIRDDGNLDYVKSAALLRNGDISALIAVVMVDACSLLEFRPHATVVERPGSGPLLDGSQYAVTRYESRMALKSDDVPGHRLIKSVMDLIGETDLEAYGEVIPYNPIAANLQSLTNVRIQVGLLSLMRAAEIVGSRRFTYREIWGTIARSILGDLTDRISRDQVRGWLAAHQPDSSDVVSRFEQLRELAGLRFSQALFGLCSPSDQENTASNPVTSMMASVDPVRDAVPGHLTAMPSDGWATPLIEAFAGPIPEGSPLEILLAQCGDGSVFEQVVTPFDHEVDMAFVTAVNSGRLSDVRRQELIAWYSSYLTRLYATANGVPAFRREVALWTLTWDTVPTAPDAIRPQLNTLLAPRRNPRSAESSFMLPVLDARAEPLIGQVAEPRLALRVSQTEVSTRRHLEDLSVILRQEGKRVASLELDFVMVREAVACAKGHLGITEFSHEASPRLERVRASTLIPKNLSGASFCLVSGDDEQAVALHTLMTEFPS